jgi:hypothetical protein
MMTGAAGATETMMATVARGPAAGAMTIAADGATEATTVVLRVTGRTMTIVESGAAVGAMTIVAGGAAEAVARTVATPRMMTTVTMMMMMMTTTTDDHRRPAAPATTPYPVKENAQCRSSD